MRAALLEAPERLVVGEAAEPSAGAGEVVVRPRTVGICGTDLSIHRGTIPVTYPRVLGHEIVGVVDDGSTEVAGGTVALIDPALACGTCRQCQEGRTNICPRGALLGRDRDGGMRDRLAVPAGNVHPLPPALDPSLAPIVQVLTTCLHAQRRMPIFPGERVVVLGLGVTGLLHIQLARLRGARVIGVTRSEGKLAIAERLGADVTIPADGSEVGEVEAAASGGADLVIECVGTVDALARAIEMIRPGGRVLAYGTITERFGELPFYELYHKEVDVVGARAARPEDFPASIELVASGRVALEPLVSDRFPLDRADEAIRAARAPGALKVLVDL
jgi:L-iditol 2-dehydrogenase